MPTVPEQVADLIRSIKPNYIYAIRALSPNLLSNGINRHSRPRALWSTTRTLSGQWESVVPVGKQG